MWQVTFTCKPETYPVCIYETREEMLSGIRNLLFTPTENTLVENITSERMKISERFNIPIENITPDIISIEILHGDNYLISKKQKLIQKRNK